MYSCTCARFRLSHSVVSVRMDICHGRCVYNLLPATRRGATIQYRGHTQESSEAVFPFDLRGRVRLHPAAPPAPGEGEDLDFELGDLVGGDLKVRESR
jgi:hypothetical protein